MSGVEFFRLRLHSCFWL